MTPLQAGISVLFMQLPSTDCTCGQKQESNHSLLVVMLMITRATLVSGGYAVGVVGGFMSHELARAVCVSLVVATIVLS